MTILTSGNRYSVRTPLSVLRSFRDHRELILQMAKREVIGRYRGSILGLVWSLFNPVLMLTVYTFVFSVVFKMRWGQGVGDSKAEFAYILFAGLIVYNLFSEVVNRAPTLLTGNANYVKKVVFPLEIFPWPVILGALFHTAVNVVVLLGFYLLINHGLPWTVVLFPLVIAPLLLLLAGFSWFLAATGVFVRDIGYVVTILTTILMFLSPIFYPISAVPEAHRSLLQLNPLAFIIAESRKVLLWGQMPDWVGLAIYSGVSLLVAWLGLIWFQKTRRGFADVL